MIEPPTIVHTTAQPAAVILITTPRSEMPKVFGPGVQELMGTLAAQGLAPAGAVFAHHLRMTAETFEFELGVPIAGSVKPAGRVRPGELPAATVARTIYHGGYEGLPAAWGEFMGWMTAQGHRPAPDLWECYVTGPHSGPDPATWRTELYRPLAK
jgi:effector-binding domain-containing protein